MYCGISPNCGGIIIVTKTNINKIFLHLDCNLANAYHAMEQRNNTPNVIIVETINELTIDPIKSLVFRTLVKLVTSSLPGIIAGGTLLITLFLFVAATNIQYNGKIERMEAMTRIAYMNSLDIEMFFICRTFSLFISRPPYLPTLFAIKTLIDDNTMIIKNRTIAVADAGPKARLTNASLYK